MLIRSLSELYETRCEKRASLICTFLELYEPSCDSEREGGGEVKS